MEHGTNSYLYRKMNRELRKMKYRAFGSASLIIFSVAFYIALAGMVPNTMKAMEDKVEELRLNDYMVHVNQGNESQLQKLADIPGVVTVEARLQLSSRAYYLDGKEEKDETSSIFGIDPSRMPEVNIPEILGSDGSYFQGNGSGTVLVEWNFAGRVGIEVGDNIAVQTAQGKKELSVIGLIFSPEFILLPVNPNSLLPYPGNLAVLFVPADWLQEAFELPGDFVNEFLFLFDEEADGKELQGKINGKLAPGVILYSIPKEEVYGYAFVKEDLEQGEQFAAIFAFVILLVAFFIVYVSFARIVQEQRKEIGILRALGYSRKAVLGSYLYMALVLGLAGSIAGILVGLPFSKVLGEFYVEMVFGIPLTGFIFPWKAMAIGFFFGPATACLASGMAVWSTVRMEPQDAIRGIPRSAIKKKRKGLLGKLTARALGSGRDPGKPETKKGQTGRFGDFLKRHYILHYTTRSMVRNRARTGFTAVAVAFSILIGALPILMMSSFENSLERSVEDYEKWDVIVEFAYPLNDTQTAELRPEQVTETVYISRIQGSWQKEAKGDFTLIAGLPLGQELHIFNREKGRLPADSSGAMLNDRFAEENDIHVGDVLRISVTSKGVDVTVTALVSDVLGEIFVDMTTMEQLTGELLYSGMYARVEPGTDDLVKEELRALPQVSEVQTRSGLKSGIIELMASYQSLIYIYSLLGVVIAAAALTNTVFIGVLERYPEYGQLRAMGYPKKAMRTSVLTEIMTIVALGSVAGAPMTWLTLVGYEGAFEEFFPGYTTILHLGDWAGYLFVVILTFTMAFLAALPSVRFINRMDVAQTVAGARFG